MEASTKKRLEILTTSKNQPWTCHKLEARHFHPFFWGGWNCCSHQPPPHFFREIFRPRKFQFSPRFPPVMAIWCCGCFQYPKSNVYTTWARWGEGGATGWMWYSPTSKRFPQHKKQKGRSKLPIPVNFLEKPWYLVRQYKKTRYLRGGGKIRISRIIKFRSSSSKKVSKLEWAARLHSQIPIPWIGNHETHGQAIFLCFWVCETPYNHTTKVRLTEHHPLDTSHRLPMFCSAI